MDAPVHQVCGTRHFRHQPCPGPKVVKGEVPGAPPDRPVVDTWVAAERQASGHKALMAEVDEKAGFDRVAYQREYMREYQRKRRSRKEE